MSVTVVFFREDPDTETTFMQSPYHQPFLEAFKELVPIGSRSPAFAEGRGWNAEEKEWGFHSDHTEDVAQLVMDMYPGDVRIVWKD